MTHSQPATAASWCALPALAYGLSALLQDARKWGIGPWPNPYSQDFSKTKRGGCAHRPRPERPAPQRFYSNCRVHASTLNLKVQNPQALVRPPALSRARCSSTLFGLCLAARLWGLPCQSVRAGALPAACTRAALGSGCSTSLSARSHCTWHSRGACSRPCSSVK